MKSITKSPHSSPTNNKFHSIIFHLLLLILLPHCHSNNSDQTTLIYHHCPSSQTSTPIALSSLFEALITHSTNSTFYRQTTAENGVPITGEYQCRGDMSFPACKSCVTQLGILSNRLCAGAETARVQARGCYVQYEADGERGKEGELGVVLHKGCGERGQGYDDGARDGALWAAAEGIARSGIGFYEARNEGVRAVAQCEGELLGCDCAECVSRAVDVVREECGAALAGEAYLDGCYVSYTTYYYTYPLGGKENGSSGTKLVAIVLGGAASLGLGFILLMFFKSCGKKVDD